MTLVVEDGSGLSTAESYISLAGANTRHTAFGNTAWTGTDAAKEAALRRATAHMEQAYRQRWKGARLTQDQALSWPRYNALVDGFALASDAVPDAVAHACADLALKALADDLNPDLTRTVIREKVGPLETEYSAHGPEATRYRAIDQALAPYLTGGGGIRLARA
jgi:hypothetical protein